jgi:hypothetical protein
MNEQIENVLEEMDVVIGKEDEYFNTCKLDVSSEINKEDCLDQEYFYYYQMGVLRSVKIDSHVREVAKKFRDLQTSGYVLYAVTLTYHDWKTHTPNAENIAEYFKEVYWHNILPRHIFEDTHWHTNPAKKAIQPYVYAFIDEHESAVTKVKYRRKTSPFEFSTRLHHHAIFAVHPSQVKKMDELTCENAIKKKLEGFYALNELKKSGKLDDLLVQKEKTKKIRPVMSSCVKRCSPTWTFYAGKKYPLHSEYISTFLPK